MNDVKRFLSKVDQNGPSDPKLGNCWNWIGHVDDQPGHGYGKFRFRGQPQMAHRVAHILFIGEIPDGLFVLHKCVGNRRCVNPIHLYVGTQKQNVQDQKDQGRFHRRNGEKVNTSKLNPSKVVLVFERFTNGYLMADIGREFGIAQGNVKKILTRQTWKHLMIPENLLTKARSLL